MIGQEPVLYCTDKLIIERVKNSLLIRKSKGMHFLWFPGIINPLGVLREHLKRSWFTSSQHPAWVYYARQTHTKCGALLNYTPRRGWERIPSFSRTCINKKKMTRYRNSLNLGSVSTHTTCLFSAKNTHTLYCLVLVEKSMARGYDVLTSYVNPLKVYVSNCQIVMASGIKCRLKGQESQCNNS